MQTIEVTLFPSQEKLLLNADEPLFQQLKRSGIHVNSTCGGHATCARCVITILKGEENLNQIPFEEERLLGNIFHITKERLSCQTRINGPITIDISMHEQPKKKTVIKRRTKDEVSELEKTREKEKELKRESRPKRLGGNKRPKEFRYEESDKKVTSDTSTPNTSRRNS